MQNLCGENEFYLLENKNHLHINVFALSLALKQRLWATQKWPMSVRVQAFATQNQSILRTLRILKNERQTYNLKADSLLSYVILKVDGGFLFALMIHLHC